MGVRSDVHLCLGEGLGPLITHVSRITPMLAWDSLVRLGVKIKLSGLRAGLSF